MGTCNDDSSNADGVFSTQVNLHTGTNELAGVTGGSIDGTQETEVNEYECEECYTLKAMGIYEGECTCGDQYTGCATPSISNVSFDVKSVLGVYYAVVLTFDYEIILDDTVSSDSYVMMSISSDDWSSSTATALLVGEGSDTASGTQSVSLTGIAEPSDDSIKIKFKTLKS